MTEQKANSYALACKAIEDMLVRSRKAQAKFKPGTSQYSLQVNRIKALDLSLMLLSNEAMQTIDHHYTTQDLKSAVAPLTSLISKSEKAIVKLRPDSWQHTMLTSNLMALKLALNKLYEQLKDDHD